ncbi:MAG: hypothetical protein EU531_06970 [Promethearchaeota archaeon]|nr:MAG: hypothetical protein EU531_06970 [Candidatus Lokiarchaeota archaeon]
MVEIELEEFESFYKDQLDDQFAKEKKAINKLIDDIREGLIEIKVCMDHFLEAGEGKIEEKAMRSLHFFSDRIRKEIDEIEIPEEDITADKITQLLNSVKKLFTNINEIARKSLPKFQKEVQAEIKELNYITRKLGKKQATLDAFLRKKYTDVREAEYLFDKLPKLFTLRDNIENAKKDLEEFEKQLKDREETEVNLNKELLMLEKNEFFIELEQKKNELFKLRMKINDKLGFKKALKKLKFELEKNTIPTANVDLEFLKKYLKDPIKMLIKERKDLPNFSALLIHLRHSLEENQINLKSDTKEKTIEQINAIFEEKTINEEIEEVKELISHIKDVEKKIEEAGLASKLEEVKNQISLNTVKLEHIQNDLERKNKDYMRYLSSLKEEREEFQKAVENVIEEEVKLNIKFTF